MSNTLKHHNLMVVDLADGILVRTDICSSHLPALRSGFAGYPANPRWNAVKFHAWKTGRQMRQAVACGKMIVRSNDSMLVPASEQESESAGSQSLPVHRPMPVRPLEMSVYQPA